VPAFLPYGLTSRSNIPQQLAEIQTHVCVQSQMFDEACELAPPEYWGPDGVHPSHAGHMLMAKTWLAAVTGSSS
jgi:lysophospholipase L1-like esterase